MSVRSDTRLVFQPKALIGMQISVWFLPCTGAKVVSSSAFLCGKESCGGYSRVSEQRLSLETAEIPQQSVSFQPRQLHSIHVGVKR